VSLPTDPEEAAFARLGDWSRPGPKRGACVLVDDEAGRILMQLRDDIGGIGHPGLWTLFGGGVEPGETLREAAVRELTEETELALRADSLRPLAAVLSSWGTSRLRLYAFVARTRAAPAALRLHEGAGFAFLTPRQIAGLPVIPEVRLVVAHFLAARG
jgi:8-oxo-dGTP pyrophosphatase MutT (NUDIX family)